MWAVGCRKFLEIGKVQVKQSIIMNAALALLVVLAAPFIFGIKNLDNIATSFVLERFVALIGIVLFTPLFSPESNQDVQELIESKYTSPTYAYLVRLFLSVIVLIVLISASLLAMQFNQCEFPIMQFMLGTLSTALFLGSLGFVSYAISSGIVIGYMVPIFYYILNMFQGENLKVFYLFSLSKDSIHEKYWLFAGAILLFAAGILVKYIYRKTR